MGFVLVAPILASMQAHFQAVAHSEIWVPLVMTAPALFSKVQGKVKEGALRNHFDEQPEFKSIKGAGHEVGDFFFVPLNRSKS